MLTSKKALILMGLLYFLATGFAGSVLFISVILISLGAVFIKTGFALNWFRAPSRLTVRAISVLGIICLIVQGIMHRQIGIAAINLLVLGCALKFLEYSSERDSYVHAAALVFLSILPLIFHYQIYIALYLMLAGILIIWIYIALTRRSPAGEDIRLMIRLFLPAVPLTAALFLVLPRFGSFWVLPGNEDSGVTGISSSFSAGNLRTLYQSDTLVARISFPDGIPSPLYFRVMTYSRYRNGEWQQDLLVSRDQNRLAYSPFAESPKDKPRAPGGIAYDVMMEPTGAVYIPALKFSGNESRDLFYSRDDTYTVNKPLRSRELFHFTWYPDYQPRNETPYSGSFLRLAPGENPRTRELVLRLTENLKTPEEKAAAIYGYFNNGFSYTLNPVGGAGAGAFGPDNHVDSFLLDTRQGFCVHYAEAMAVMLRMAGIPSRIVSGYAGGESVPDLNMVIIREYDAHAWTEAFIEGKWVSFDPVLLVSREFARSGGYSAIREGYRAPSGFAGLWKQIRDITENLEYSWSRFILNFDTDYQEKLLKNSLPLIIGLVAGGLLVYVIFFLITLLGGRSLRRDPPEIRLMKKAFRALARRGIPAGTGETPAAFAARLSLLSSETAVPDPAQKQPGNRKELSPASLKLIAGEFAALAYEFSLLRYGKTPQNHKELLRGLRSRADKIVKICTTS